jgi:hypothetical protein
LLLYLLEEVPDLGHQFDGYDALLELHRQPDLSGTNLFQPVGSRCPTGFSFDG